MAQQTGPLKYKGTIGGIRHFKIKGLSGHFAGMAGGPDANQVRTAPEFARTRENMNEFGGCAAAAKSLRVGLAQLIKQMSDPQLTGRLTAIMKKINLEDQTEPRGYRAILITSQPQYLSGLNFNRNLSFDSIFFAPINFTSAPTRNSVELSVEPFNPLNFINPPAGATHFRLISAISVLSDYVYNSTSGIYEPMETEINELSNVANSEYLSLSDPILSPITIENELPGAPAMTPDVSVLNCVGIEFYQKVGTSFYKFNSGNCLKIQSII
jgi:hypothetical protein